MTSTNLTTIATRVSQCLAATALMAAIAIGAAATAGAERVWDLDEYDKCMANWNLNDEQTLNQWEEWRRFQQGCCLNSGGVWDAEYSTCTAPAPEAENVPQPPGQPTEPPPVLQNPPAQPSNPLIPTPRGPNSGTVG